MKYQKNILIVEDELLIASQLKMAILNHGYFCAGIAMDYRAAENILETKSVDIALLDIRISGKKTGLDIAALLKNKYGIPFLFITSFNDKDTLDKIKELSPKGYINKPVNEIMLLTTLDIVFNNMENNKATSLNLNIGTTTYNIHISDLLYVESDHVYVRLFYKTRTSLIRSSLTNFLELMPKDSLVRISRGVAVNPNFIERIEKTKIKLSGKEFKLSKNYEENLHDFYSQKN